MNNITEKLINLSAKVALTKDQGELLRIAAELNVLASQTLPPTDEKATTDYLRFTKKEIANMSKTFKKEFIAHGCVARITKRPSGKRTFCYEIRYRRNGFNISASSTDIEEAKKKFSDATHNALQAAQAVEMPQSVATPTQPFMAQSSHMWRSSMLFRDIADEWFKHRRGKILDSTYDGYEYYYKKYLSSLNGKDIRQVSTAHIDDIMATVESGRQYEEVRSVVNQIFKYAIANGLLSHNPVSLVPFIRAEREHGKALSLTDEWMLVQVLKQPENKKIRQPLLTMLFFGLRPCELTEAHFEEDFLVARNRKRKKGKIEYKKIPISPMAKKYMDLSVSPVPHCQPGRLNKLLKNILPNNTAYDLRHTFSTRCQQFVRQDIVEIWLGDSPTRLIGSTYTHFPDEFVINEMNKVSYEYFVPQNVPLKSDY